MAGRDRERPVVDRRLDKLGFDRLLDKAGINRFTGPSFDPATIIVKLVDYFILLIALQLALSAFGDQNPVSQIVNDIVTWLPKGSSRTSSSSWRLPSPTR